MGPKSICSSAEAQNFYMLSNVNLNASPHQAIYPDYDLFMTIIQKFPALLFPPLNNPTGYLSLVSFLQVDCSKNWSEEQGGPYEGNDFFITIVNETAPVK